jgi:ATP phosphoribosyltransferase
MPASPGGTAFASPVESSRPSSISASGGVAWSSPISGAAEVAPHLGIADVIVDLVSTGSTLRVNGLTEIATVLESSARLVARPRSGRSASVTQSLDDLTFALSSVIRARDKRYLMANVPRSAIAAVQAELPGLTGPTVVDVRGTDFVAVHAVVAASDVYKTTLRLKAIGCEGILVTRIERLIP